MKGKNVMKSLCLCLAMCLLLNMTASFPAFAKKSKVKKLTFKNKSISLKVGKKKTLKVTVKPAKFKKKLKWVSSNKKIVSVSKKGVIKGKKKGSAKVTVFIGKNLKKAQKKTSCKVTVKKPNDTVTDPVTDVPTPIVTEAPVTQDPTPIGATEAPVTEETTPAVTVPSLPTDELLMTGFLFSNATENEEGRLSLSMNGRWKYADYPEYIDKNNVGKINTDPYAAMGQDDFDDFIANVEDSNWRNITVPGDLINSNTLSKLHRVWYRAQVAISPEDINRGFYLDMDGTNWIATVVVNGEVVGSKKSTRVPWDLDVTNYLKAGTNDIYIGIKSPRYAIDPKATSVRTKNFFQNYTKLSDYFAMETNGQMVVPWDMGMPKGKLFWVAPIYPSSKGIAEGHKFGITDRVHLASTPGRVYTNDVYVKTNVVDDTTFEQTAESKHISADVTLYNSSDTEKTVSVSAKAVHQSSGQVGKELGVQTITLAPSEEKLVSFENVQWSDAELWWPEVEEDKAPMYDLTVDVTEGDTTTDIYKQPFGFRDIKIDGKYFRINGLRRKFWNALAGLEGTTPEEIISNFKSTNNRFERYGADLGLASKLPNSPNPDQQLDWLDENGLPVRFCSMIDGMGVNFELVYDSNTSYRKLNTVLFENFREHIEQMIVEYRNHPSIIVWSLENELLFINSENVYGWIGSSREVVKLIEQQVNDYFFKPAKDNDPTRESMLDGGGAGHNNDQPIYCHHYLGDGSNKVTSNKVPLVEYDYASSHGGWVYDGKKPFVAGEVAYYSGLAPEHFWIGGEDMAATDAYSKYVRYIYNRYRWGDAAMIFPWFSVSSSRSAHSSIHPIAAIPEDYRDSMYASKGFKTEVKVFNDTFSKNQITFEWKFYPETDSSAIQSGGGTYTIEPGLGEVVKVEINSISGITERTKGYLELKCTQTGTDTFTEKYEYAIHPDMTLPTLTNTLYTYNVSDKVKSVLPGTPNVVNNTSEINGITDGNVLLVGDNGILNSSGNGDSAAIVSAAKRGVKVVVLEQTNMFTATSSQVTGGNKENYVPTVLSLPSSSVAKKVNDSYITFAQGFGSDILYGLEQSDLSYWNGFIEEDWSPTTKNLWAKPEDGAISWVSAGSSLAASALLQIPAGKGVILATQLRVGEKIDVEPAAQRLLYNMLTVADKYQLPSSTVGILSNTKEAVKNALAAAKVVTLEKTSINDLLNMEATQILVLEATPTNLSTLNTLKTAVDSYVSAGGWIMFTDLTPDGLSQYNTLLGTEHMIRPFRREAVKNRADWVTVGLSTADYYLYNSNYIASWKGLYDVSKDTFTYCVDATNDIAPFHDYEGMNPPGGNAYTPSNIEWNPGNMVNDLTSLDHWFYFMQTMRETGTVFTFSWPKAFNITGVEFFNSTVFDSYKDFTIKTYSGDTEKESVSRVLPKSSDGTNFEFQGEEADSVELIADSFYATKGSYSGINEIRIYRETPDWITSSGAQALTSNGAIVKYTRNDGGFILNNAKLDGDFDSNEPNSNISIKQKYFKIILRNIGAKPIS